MTSGYAPRHVKYIFHVTKAPLWSDRGSWMHSGSSWDTKETLQQAMPLAAGSASN